MQTETHAATAAQIARDTAKAELPLLGRDGRQGDVYFWRLGDLPAAAAWEATPEGGVQIQVGAHGEHRLVGEAVAWPEPGQVMIQGEALVVHTDVPDARHGALRLGPGCWGWRRSIELGADDVVQEVKD